MDSNLLRYIAYAAVVVFLIVLVMYFIDKKDKGTNSQEVVGYEKKAEYSQESTDTKAECKPLGGECTGTVSNVSTAYESGVRPDVRLQTACHTSRNQSLGSEPASMSPWISEMFAGAPPVTGRKSAGNINVVFNECTTQTLEKNDEVGFGLKHASALQGEHHQAKPTMCASCTA